MLALAQLMLVWTTALNAQAGIKYYFVAPTATITGTFGGAADNASCPVGYAKVEITAANSAQFLTVAPTRIRYVYEQLQPGRPLRTHVEKVMRISGSTIDINYYLIDDRNGLTTPGSTGIFLGITFSTANGYDGRKHVWPTGGSGGRVRLGEYQMERDQSHRAGGNAAIDELVLHESSHTQFTGPWSRWDGYITYGADEQHYGNELQGDPEAALNEGIGTFYGYLLNPTAITEMNNFFARADDRYFVEGQSVVAGRPELYNVSTRRRSSIGDVLVWRYTWLEIPGDYATYSERTPTAYFTYFWQNVNGNRDQALEMIISASNSMYDNRRKRFLSYASNRLAIKMEEFAATAAGQTARTNGTLTSSLFPYALLDLLTHFAMTETEYKADHDRNYPDRNPQAYTAYWSHRNAIKQLVQADLAASPIRFSDALRKIHDYCKTPANIVP